MICSHGSSKFLQEKFFDHSDGFTEYICRCGKAAVVNTKKNIYKCKYCKDNADISRVQTSWTSKLAFQELRAMNIGVRQYLAPYTYQTEMPVLGTNTNLSQMPVLGNTELPDIFE